MKRTILTAAVVAMLFSTAMAQTKKAIDDYKAQIENSDKEVADAKKGSQTKVWENRGKLLVEAFRANTKGIYASMPASKSDANLFNNLELIAGAPTEKKTEGEYELWVYPTVTYYIQNDQVQYWRETYIADADALPKAVDAFRKAAELDPKGAYKDKKTTKELIKDLRNALYNDGINAYMLKDFKTATKDFSKALELVEFPRAESDSIIQDGQIAYYAALCANESGDKVQAERMFKKAADMNYQISSCYHYIYLITKEKGDEDAAFKILTDAYKKYPTEEQLLYDVINYYLEKKQYTEAENYLNTAINEHPNNLVLYSVKASIYVNNYTALKDKYKTDLNKCSEFKKAAFRERGNPKEQQRLEGEAAAQQKVADATKADFLANQNKANDCYKKMLAKDANNYDANFMLGIVSYDRAEIYQIEKDLIPMSEDKDGSKAAAKDKEMHACWKESCEWFEKAHKAKPTEANPLQNLKMLYYKLGDTANNKRVKDILDNM
ncbi:MAG: tetratricopeptide repeat protein [Bacteroidales bacterium]|nr:tetratricopeptide repeat protein [Bacteroidales bacterium]